MRRSHSPSQMYRSQSNIPRRSPISASPPLVVLPIPTYPYDHDGGSMHMEEVTVELGRIYRADPAVPAPPLVYANNNYRSLSHDDLAGMMEAEMEGDESGEMASEVRIMIVYFWWCTV